MKITIINPSPDEEEEIIIKCRVLTDDINHLICKLKNGDRKITKSMILNLDKIRHLSPAFGGRFEALLENEEKVIISRQYVPVLKERLGL